MICYQPPLVSLVPGKSALDFKNIFFDSGGFARTINAVSRFPDMSMQQRVFVVTRKGMYRCSAPEDHDICHILARRGAHQPPHGDGKEMSRNGIGSSV